MKLKKIFQNLFKKIFQYIFIIIYGKIKLLDHNHESFFKTKPDAKFISFDIDYDNILELKKFINIKDYKTLPKTNVSNTIQTKDANYKILDEYREKYIKYKKKYNDLKALLKSKKIS